MTTEEMKLDALLHIGSQRLMRAGESILQLRTAIQEHNHDDLVRASTDFAEHMEVAEATFVEVQRISAAARIARTHIAQIAARQQGGLVH